MKKLLPAAIAAALLAAPSQAVVGVSYIQVSNVFNTWLQVGELIATETGTGNNVALGSVGAVATNTGGAWDANSTPDRAIDGNINTAFYVSPYIFHPGVEGGSVLTITLSGLKSLSGLSIYGRSDCCSERDLFSYTLFGADQSVLGSGTLDARNNAHFASVDVAGDVPEPVTWGLMVLGFGALGASMRRTRADDSTLTA